MTDWLHPHPLVLASKSEARRHLLEMAGVPFEVLPADINERELEDSALKCGCLLSEVPTLLARHKALHISDKRRDQIILGSDQCLDVQNGLIHRPENLNQAKEQLLYLSGQTHTLISSAVLCLNNTVIYECVEKAELSMRTLSEEFIDLYINKLGHTVIKSVGCYQVEGLGIHLFDRILGHQSTIMGLPLISLLKGFRALGHLKS